MSAGAAIAPFAGVGQGGQPPPMGGGGRVPTVEEAAAKLAEVAARAEFAPPTETWLDRLRQSFVDRRDELLSKLFEWLGFDGQLAEGFGVWVGFALLAVLVGVTVWIASRALRAAQRGASAKAPVRPAAGRGDELASRALLARAAELARAGRYEQALTTLYAGSLLALDERGLVRFEERKTAREYGRELSGETRDHWRALVGAFEPAVYGQRGGGREAWDAACAAARSLGVEA